MGFFSKLWKGPEVDLEKSGENAKKMRQMFDRVVENGGEYRLISGYTEDVSRFNYGFVHGSRRKVGSLIVGWNEESQTIVVVPTVPDLSGCGEPVYYRRADILKAYRNRYPTDAFVIYPDSRGYIAINAYDWLEDESLYIYVSQGGRTGRPSPSSSWSASQKIRPAGAGEHPGKREKRRRRGLRLRFHGRYGQGHFSGLNFNRR